MRKSKESVYETFAALGRELECARSAFAMASAPLEVEAAIYRMQELETRRRMLLEKERNA